MRKLKKNSISQTIVLLIIFSIGILQFSYIKGMFTVKPKVATSKRSYGRSKMILDALAEQGKKRNLLIFLDTSEKDALGPICRNFVLALYQKAGPIIVSSSLMCTLLEWRKKDDRSAGYLLDEMEEKLSVVTTDSWLIVQNDIAACKIAFDPDNWIIKEVNNSLFLLVPKSYCELLNIDSEKVKEYSNISSDAELQLGLKVNHMKTIEYTKIRRAALRDYFVNSLDNIFCEKSEYRVRSSIRTEWNGYNDTTTISIPEWIIYINGHGLIHHSIVDLSLEQFKEFLFFLETKIKTHLLVVSSCYVAGTNINNVYGEIKFGLQQQNSFPIIIEGLNDLGTFGNYIISDSGEWAINKKLALKSANNFFDFFERAKQERSNYREVIKPIMKLSDTSIRNEPQIKLPGIEWFSVMDTDQRIVSIGSLLAKTRNPQKPLYISSFFKKDPQIILFYTDNIPFELVINSPIKAIVSMVSTDSNLARIIHRVKKISAPTYDLYDLLNLFSISVVDSNYAKWFFIDEISSHEGIVKNILIDGAYEDGMNAYFNKSNSLYKLNIKDKKRTVEEIEKGSYDEYHYNEGMYIARHQYPKLFQNKPGGEEEITSEQIKKIEGALKKVPAKVLESRRQVEEARRAREQTLIE